MIETSPISTRQDDDRQALLSYLPKRIEAFEQRIRRYSTVGWDAAGMMVLRGDIQRLAETSGRYDMVETRQNLRKLAQRVGDHITRRTTPDPQQVSQMLVLLSSVIESLARLPEPRPRSVPSATAPPVEPRNELPVAVPDTAEPVAHADGMAPAGATSEIGHNTPAEAAAPAGNAAPAVSTEPALAVDSVEPTVVAGSTVRAEPAGLFEPDEPAATNEIGLRRLYHLSDGNAASVELAQRLESEGYGVESLDTFDDLSELVMCMLPHVLVVDASHISELAAIGNLRREAQQRVRPQRHIHLVAMAAQRSMDTRRAAHRAGVDLLLVPPIGTDEIIERLQALHSTAPVEKMCVLIVEDNRADAFYAQTVLAKAGMQAHVEHDPMRVLESLEVLHPDLVLMDLHMPFANGVEVTLLIRDHPVFARLPIVFLSGESDPDSRLEATNAGGDDFLFKPIRPKHLVAAVRDRMRHAHTVRKPPA